MAEDHIFFFLAEVWQESIFNWSSVVFRSIMHTLVGILLFTAHQNPVLVTRNETELGSTEKCSDFQKTVIYCYISRLCYFCLTSNSKAIVYKTAKELFYKLFIWYIIYIIHIDGSEFTCLNSIYCISSVFMAQFHMPIQNIHLIGAGRYWSTNNKINYSCNMINATKEYGTRYWRIAQSRY